MEVEVSLSWLTQQNQLFLFYLFHPELNDHVSNSRVVIDGESVSQFNNETQQITQDGEMSVPAKHR